MGMEAEMPAEHRWARLAAQEVHLCVPASFDAAARELTLEAARAAGLERVTLLEEPLAAFYAWLHGKGDDWRTLLRKGDVVLAMAGKRDFQHHDHFQAWFRLEAKVGQTVDVEILRDGERRTIRLPVIE